MSVKKQSLKFGVLIKAGNIAQPVIRESLKEKCARLVAIMRA